MDIEAELQALKQQVDQALLAFEWESKKLVDIINIDQHSDLTKSLILLHQKIMEYHARHETLFEKLEMNESFLSRFWLNYLKTGPKKDFSIVFLAYLETINNAILSERVDISLWRQIFPSPNDYLDITRRLAWAEMQYDEKEAVVNKYKAINVHLPEFYLIEIKPWLSHRRNVRNLIMHAFKTDSILSAFLLDFFPELYSNLSGQQDRTTKINLLLESEEVSEIALQVENCVGRDAFRRIIEYLMKIKEPIS